MKQIPLILAFLSTTLLCFGQKEHLELPKSAKINPTDSLYFLKIKAYSDKFNALLYKDLSQKPYARYVCRPSFTASYAFSVEKIKGESYIISNKFSTSHTEIVNYWIAGCYGGKDTVKIETHKIKINNDLYLKIGELFELLAEQTKEKEKERVFVTLPDGEIEEILFARADGTDYYFTTTDKNGEIRTSTTWSPHPSSKPMLSSLVEICDKLCSLRNGNNILQANILEEIEILIKDLKK